MITEIEQKPNCYACIHRRNIPGDAHSACGHPSNAEALNNPLAQLFGILASVKRVEPFQVTTKVHVTGNPLGIRNGWFMWPFNFDPVWLESCDGFSPKSGEDTK